MQIKQNNPINKWAVCKGEVQIANKHVKDSSTTPAARKMQIKTTLRCCLTPVRMSVTKKTTTNSTLNLDKKGIYTLLVAILTSLVAMEDKVDEINKLN